MPVIPNDDCIMHRSNMPQIDAADIPELLVFLGSREISLLAGFIAPEKVKAHQAVDIIKALSMPEPVTCKPVLLSSDNAVLDGDHRWYWHLINNKPMPFIQLGVDFVSALSHLYAFPKCYEYGDGAVHPVTN